MGAFSVRILVVEDDAAMREVLRARLQAWGFEVDVAVHGLEARERVALSEPDIVISDVFMPEFSGLELLRCLKLENPSRPVILITVQED